MTVHRPTDRPPDHHDHLDHHDHHDHRDHLTTTTVTTRTTATLIDHAVVTVVEQLNRKTFNWCDVIPRHTITVLKDELSFDSAPEH